MTSGRGNTEEKKKKREEGHCNFISNKTFTNFKVMPPPNKSLNSSEPYGEV